MLEIEKKVRELYEAKNPERDEWADWMYENHVIDVADRAEKLAREKGANPELARVAALLHDVADAFLNRFDTRHEKETLLKGRILMQESGYGQADIKAVVNDAGANHGCKNDVRPETEVGRVLATADAMSHIETDFYDYFKGELLKRMSISDYKQQAIEKLDRDFKNKIQYENIREQVRPRYEEFKSQIQSFQ